MSNHFQPWLASQVKEAAAGAMNLLNAQPPSMKRGLPGGPSFVRIEGLRVDKKLLGVNLMMLPCCTV
jgi:hypothetical protein